MPVLTWRLSILVSSSELLAIDVIHSFFRKGLSRHLTHNLLLLLFDFDLDAWSPWAAMTRLQIIATDDNVRYTISRLLEEEKG